MNTDVVIIGAGPSGLFAGFYAGMRKLDCVIIDQLEMPGGRLSALYPTKYIYDVPGFDKVKAQDLVDNLLKQLDMFKDTSKLLLGQSVLEINKDGDNFVVKTNNETINTKSVIIAGGTGAFSPRKLGLENEDNVSNIHYFVDEPNKYKDKDVVIFGGGDSAVDYALLIEDVAKSVSIVHRRDDFRAHGSTVDNLKASSINIYTPYTPSSLNIEDNKVKSILISNKEEDTKELVLDDIVVSYGFVANLGPIKDWNLNINEKNKIEVDTFQQTNIQGIFAIGDICTYPGKADLITTGFGEAPVAINSCFSKIHPDQVLGVLHSSSHVGDK
ncbi:MAG: NAD(P)/FAD-dependent oxidoreductase [Mycoplasmatales bacterium]